MIKQNAFSAFAQTGQTGLMAAAFLLVTTSITLAAGEPQSVGQLMTQTDAQIASQGFFDVVGIICLVIGTMFGIQVMNGAIGYTSPNGNVKLSGLAWRTAGAAAFFNLPKAIGFLRTVIAGGAKQDATVSNVVGNVGSVTDGLDGALVNMISDLQQPMAMLTGTIAFLSGLFMIGSGLLALSNQNFAQDNTSKKAIVARLGIGTLLTAFASSVKSILMTVFQSSVGDSTATLAYDSTAFDAATSAQINGVLNAIFVWLAMIGLIAILRGLWIMKDLLEKGGGLTGPVTHLVAGGMLVNMGPTVRLIEKTLDVPGIT